MRKSLLHFILVFYLFWIFSPILFSQAGWVLQTSNTVNNLHSVSFVDANTGIAIGNSGTVLMTTNGGINWTTQNSGTPNHLYGVFLLNANTGWISGDVGVILKTTNGGLNWVQQNSTSVYQLHEIQFINSTTGICAGWYGTILRTTNGGTIWVSQNSGTTRNLIGVSFVNANSGYVAGLYGTIGSSTNAGTTWNLLTSGTVLSLEDIFFTDINTGIVVGEGGRVQKTTNAGLNWVAQTSGTGSWLMGISTQSVVFSTIVGETGTIRKTSNGGTNWLGQTSNTGNYLNFVCFTDTNNGFAVGDVGTIIHTTTGGWLLPSAPALSAPNTGTTCFSLTGTLSWTTVAPPVAYYRVQISTNQTFTNIVLDTNYIMNTSYAIRTGALNYNTLYYWRVMATNQVGSSPWSVIRNFTTTLASPLAPNLTAPPNNSTGQSLTPLLDWDSTANASTYRVRLAIDSMFTNIIIDSGGIAVTQLLVPAGRLNNNVKYYWKVNASNTCVTGNWSATWNFRTLITGISINSGIMPKEFKLYNNYPNPFNPSTQIKFDIPSDEMVILKIYDMAGTEVKTLVSEHKNAGSYNYTFNPEGLASGIYIYKIDAGKYSAFSKMVFLK